MNKRLITLLLAILFSKTAFAQVGFPNGISATGGTTKLLGVVTGSAAYPSTSTSNTSIGSLFTTNLDNVSRVWDWANFNSSSKAGSMAISSTNGWVQLTGSTNGTTTWYAVALWELGNISSSGSTSLPWSVPWIARFNWVPCQYYDGRMIYTMGVGMSSSIYPNTAKGVTFNLLHSGTCELRIVGSSTTVSVTTTGSFGAGYYGQLFLAWDGSSVAKAYVATSQTPYSARPTLLLSATAALSGSMASAADYIGLEATVTSGTLPSNHSINFAYPKLYFP